MIVIIMALTMSSAFYWIPSAALAAIIFVAITNIISISDFWVAWKHSRKDFVVLLVTFSFTFLFETAHGLIAGVIVSLLVHLHEVAYSTLNTPISRVVDMSTVGSNIDLELNCVVSKEKRHTSRVEIIRLGNDLSLVIY